MSVKSIAYAALAALLLGVVPPASLSAQYSGGRYSGAPVQNAGVRITDEEVLFFSAQAGTWTPVALDLTERVQRWGAAGDVAAVVTSKRVLGFSAPLNQVAAVPLPITEDVRTFRVRGNFASVSTGERVLGFSAVTGEWSVIDTAG